MLTAIQLLDDSNNQAVLFTLAVADSSASPGYQVTNVDGLGPVAATINSADYANESGAAYQGSRTGKRNIVITLKVEPDYSGGKSLRTLRSDMYKYLFPGAPVHLRFLDDQDDPWDISGYVETNAPTLNTASSTNQISIINVDPYFKGITATGFTMVDNTLTPVYYTGTAPTGFTAEIDVTHAFTSFNLVNFRTFDNIELDDLLNTGLTQFSVGDKIQISTVKGNRYLQVIHGDPDNPINLLDNLSSGSLLMSIGNAADQFFLYTFQGNTNNSPQGNITTFNYTPAYVGY